jgi:hypothetical protein
MFSSRNSDETPLKLADIKSHGAEAGRHKGNGEIVTSED